MATPSGSSAAAAAAVEATVEANYELLLLAVISFLAQHVTTLNMSVGAPRATNGFTWPMDGAGNPTDTGIAEELTVAMGGDQPPHFAEETRTVVDLGGGILVGELSPADYTHLILSLPKIDE